jgi:hypothetical protein
MPWNTRSRLPQCPGDDIAPMNGITPDMNDVLVIMGSRDSRGAVVDRLFPDVSQEWAWLS